MPYRMSLFFEDEYEIEAESEADAVSMAIGRDDVKRFYNDRISKMRIVWTVEGNEFGNRPRGYFIVEERVIYHNLETNRTVSNKDNGDSNEQSDE